MAYRKSCTLDVWPGHLDSGRLDDWTLDPWTQDDWALALWTLRLWATGRSGSGQLDSGRSGSERLDSGQLHAWTLDPWTMDNWRLQLWTSWLWALELWALGLTKFNPYLVTSFLLLFRHIIYVEFQNISNPLRLMCYGSVKRAANGYFDLNLL